MNTIMKAIVVLSVGANGFFGGLIAGHLMNQQGVCNCKRERREDGPFPTGWVVPEEPQPAKPKPSPGSVR